MDHARQNVSATPRSHADKRADFAALAARHSLAVGLPSYLGGCHFYEVLPGWQKGIFDEDHKARVVETAWDLEDALEAGGVDTVYIPLSSTLTQATARRICARFTQAKSVFFEIEPVGDTDNSGPFNLRKSSENDHE